MVDRRRRLVAAGTALLLVPCGACRPELVVSVATRVYADGSANRSVAVRGRTAEGDLPTDKAWLREAIGIRLAEPRAWGRTDAGPGWLTAEGFFQSVDQFPPLLAYGPEARRDRGRTELTLDARTVIERRVYRERYGDPYGPADAAAALDALVELGVEALRSELRRSQGARVETAPAEAFLRGPARSLAAGLLGVQRRVPGLERIGERERLWRDLLAQHGLSLGPLDSEEFWTAALPAIAAWSGAGVAHALNTGELGFWPAGEDASARFTEIAERVWGSEERLQELAAPHLAMLAGYYGGDTAPHARFEVRVALPGVLLRTNGTPDGGDVIWLLREGDLAFSDTLLEVESVELLPDALKTLGARTDLDRDELVQLHDLLWRRDPEQALAKLLARAHAEASLALLRDKEQVPEELRLPAHELAELLEPRE